MSRFDQGSHWGRGGVALIQVPDKKCCDSVEVTAVQGGQWDHMVQAQSSLWQAFGALGEGHGAEWGEGGRIDRSHVHL